MTNDDVRRRTAEIASHLAEVQVLARSIRHDHPDGPELYRALNHGCLPSEYADPVGLIEDVLQYPKRYTQEDNYERLR